MLESHLSQFTEQLQLLISQIAATRLHEMAETLTSRMRSKFQNMAKVCSLLGQLSQCWVVTVESGSDLSINCRVKR